MDFMLLILRTTCLGASLSVLDSAHLGVATLAQSVGQLEVLTSALGTSRLGASISTLDAALLGLLPSVQCACRFESLLLMPGRLCLGALVSASGILQTESLLPLRSYSHMEPLLTAPGTVQTGLPLMLRSPACPGVLLTSGGQARPGSLPLALQFSHMGTPLLLRSVLRPGSSMSSSFSSLGAPLPACDIMFIGSASSTRSASKLGVFVFTCGKACLDLLPPAAGYSSSDPSAATRNMACLGASASVLQLSRSEFSLVVLDPLHLDISLLPRSSA